MMTSVRKWPRGRIREPAAMASSQLLEKIRLLQYRFAVTRIEELDGIKERTMGRKMQNEAQTAEGELRRYLGRHLWDTR